jgi:hypothetical protein
MDQNLLWTLKDWESRYAAVSLHQGLVLTLSDDRRYLAQTEPLGSLIARTLAPGVYILQIADMEEAAAALQKAGVDIIAQPPSVRVENPGQAHSSYPSLGNPSGSELPAESIISQESPIPELGAEFPTVPGPRLSADSLKEQFRKVLERMRFPKAEQDELTARIDRRLILSESQLTGGVVRSEKLEARNLDYLGKTVVAKQAITLRSLIEVLWTSPGGGENQVFGVPEALEKQGGETILVLKPIIRGAASNEPMRLPLGKISLLRRIKQSIFGE